MQTFTALWDPQRLQNNEYALYNAYFYSVSDIMHTFYSVRVGDPTMQ